MEIYTSITRSCVVVQRKPHLYQLAQEQEQIKILVHGRPSHTVKGALHRRVNLQTTCTWMNKIYLVSFVENSPLDSHKQNTTCCLIRGRNSTYLASYNPFFSSNTNITHDGDGSKRVDPRLTLYKSDKSYSSKVSPDLFTIFFPCVLERKLT